MIWIFFNILFSYTCDEFVINDTKEKHLEQLRISLQTNPE